MGGGNVGKCRRPGCSNCLDGHGRGTELLCRVSGARRCKVVLSSPQNVLRVRGDTRVEAAFACEMWVPLCVGTWAIEQLCVGTWAIEQVCSLTVEEGRRAGEAKKPQNCQRWWHLEFPKHPNH